MSFLSSLYFLAVPLKQKMPFEKQLGLKCLINPGVYLKDT